MVCFPLSSPQLLLWTLFLLCPLITSQSNSPQNIETHYPFSLPLPPPSPPPPSPPPPPPALPPPPPVKTSSGSSNNTIAKAVAVTAASTIIVSALFFFVLRRRAMSRRRKGEGGPRPSNGVLPLTSRDEFSRFDGNIRGLIVDENGLDVLYWRKLQGSKGSSPRQRSSFKRLEAAVVVGSPTNGGEHGAEEGTMQRRSQEVPLLRGKSSTSELNSSLTRPQAAMEALKPPETITLAAIPASATAVVAPPPPPPPPPQSKNPRPPPLPVLPPKPGGTASSFKPPPPPVPKIAANKAEGSSSSMEGGSDQVKLKPLHWDKVNVEKGNSMVWNKIEGGSFKVDDDLMEALFGYVATNRKTPKGGKTASSPGSSSPGHSGQIFILDTRKSQNISIVLKSLSVSRKDILDALMEGRGLDGETLEKLNNIAPTKEEESEILAFGGDPTRLADAESFLFHILRAIPSAFTRFSAMLFKLNYKSEILQVRESIQTVELGCKELRTRGLFMKLLEAILKAGNRMNAGTARGNAQAFNLSALKKLSDVKSKDGKTTLLHFVVEEVVRSEGRRCVISRSRSLSRSGSMNTENPTLKDDKEKEYIMLGLPVVGGLSAEFSNVKRAASIDYESFAGLCAVLQSRVTEVRQLVSRCEEDGGRFAREMEGFLESADAEIASLRKDQASAVELVKATAEYYQAGASKEKGSNPIKIFVIIRDFLGMVDQVCIEVARNVQKKKRIVAGAEPPDPDSSRKTMRFPKLPPDFLSDNKSNDSDSDS